LPVEVWQWTWWESVTLAALARLPVMVPFALATIIGGIDCTESAAAAETYKPGQVVPRDGTVECARHHDVQDHVKAGTRFAPCAHHHEHSEGCTWQYV